jgi:hypothetical protein
MPEQLVIKALIFINGCSLKKGAMTSMICSGGPEGPVLKVYIRGY